MLDVPIRMVDIALVCPCHFERGDAYVAAPGGRIYAVYVGCGACGVANIIYAEDDRAHGPQVVEVAAEVLHGLRPGFACCSCKARQAVVDGRVVSASEGPA